MGSFIGGGFSEVGLRVEIAAVTVVAGAALFTDADGVFEATGADDGRFGAIAAEAGGAVGALPADLSGY